MPVGTVGLKSKRPGSMGNTTTGSVRRQVSDPGQTPMRVLPPPGPRPLSQGGTPRSGLTRSHTAQGLSDCTTTTASSTAAAGTTTVTRKCPKCGHLNVVRVVQEQGGSGGRAGGSPRMPHSASTPQLRTVPEDSGSCEEEDSTSNGGDTTSMYSEASTTVTEEVDVHTGTGHTHRNARTAPSTPEAEMRVVAPPRHAESTSQLEMVTSRKSPTPPSIGGGSTNGKGSDGPTTDKHSGKEVSRKVNKSRNEKFHRLFKSVSEEELVLKSYSCAYFGDILLQGYLYISTNWFCFYSKILGHEKQIEIPVESVLNLSREKTAFFIPNAIGILTPQDKFVFGSLMSRDSTYRLMWNVWKQARGDLSDKAELDAEFADALTELVNGDSGSENNNLHMKPEIQLPSSTTESECSSDHVSVCTECGTPLTEHELGEYCDNMPGEHPTDHQDSRSFPGMMSAASSPITSDSGMGMSALADNSELSLTPPPNGLKLSQSSTSWKYFGYQKTCAAFSHVVVRVHKVPRTSLLLLACCVLACLLVGSAVVMTYKLLLLQARLDTGMTYLTNTPTKEKLYGDLYFLKHTLHTATVEQFHQVLQANIHLLQEVYQSLDSLHGDPADATVTDKSCGSQSKTCTLS